jgi:SAM-dependent methyltransferase
MEYTVCNLCGSKNSLPLFNGRDRMHGGAETFQSVRCQNCGLIYLNPRPTPDEIDQYYPVDYEPFTRSGEGYSWLGRLGYRVSMNKKYRIAGLGINPGKLLDIGCGRGDFLLWMKRYGWEVYGLDLSLVAVDVARKRGLEIFQGQLIDAPYPPASFDVITMWDVLEHVHDPLSNLKRVFELLKPGGRYTVTLPNPDGLDFLLFGRNWTGLDMPRHLYVYSRKPLTALLKKAGLTVLSSRCITGGQRVSTWSIEWLIDEKVSNDQQRRFLKKIINSQLWYWLWRPFYFILDLFRWGSSITYVCQKVI